jgi:hypothetical protein
MQSPFRSVTTQRAGGRARTRRPRCR